MRSAPGAASRAHGPRFLGASRGRARTARARRGSGDPASVAGAPGGPRPCAPRDAPCRDLGVGVAQSEEPQHVELALCEVVGWWSGLPRHGCRHQVGGSTDGLDQFIARCVLEDARNCAGVHRVADEPRILLRQQDHDGGLGGDLRHGTDGVERRDVPGPLEVEHEHGRPVARHRLDRRLGAPTSETTSSPGAPSRSRRSSERTTARSPASTMATRSPSPTTHPSSSSRGVCVALMRDRQPTDLDQLEAERLHPPQERVQLGLIANGPVEHRLDRLDRGLHPLEPAQVSSARVAAHPNLVTPLAHRATMAAFRVTFHHPRRVMNASGPCRHDRCHRRRAQRPAPAHPRLSQPSTTPQRGAATPGGGMSGQG
jgi:hypothetical protein